MLYVVHDEDAGRGLVGTNEAEAELGLHGFEDGGGIAGFGASGRSSAGSAAMVTVASGAGTVGVVVTGGTAPVERDVVLALEPGLVIDGETDLVGENAGKVGGSLVVGAIAGGATEGDDPGVAVVAACSTPTEASVLRGTGCGFRSVSRFLKFGAVFRDGEVITLEGLFGEVSGEAEAVFQQILQHDLKLIGRSSGLDPGHDIERGGAKRGAAGKLVVLQIPGFRDERGEGAAGAAVYAGVGSARPAGAGAGVTAEAKTCDLARANGGDLELGFGLLGTGRDEEDGAKSKDAEKRSHDG